MPEPRIDPGTAQRMIEAARQAMQNSHAPLSHFHVGAAILTTSGGIYAGCNIESLIPSLGVCAERAAIDHAIVHGERKMAAVLVLTGCQGPLWPCGACRQYLYEFVQGRPEDFTVLAAYAQGLETASLADLLPRPFGLKEKETLSGNLSCSYGT